MWDRTVGPIRERLAKLANGLWTARGLVGEKTGEKTRLAVVQHEVLVEKLRILIRDAARVLPAHVDPPLADLRVDLLVDLLVDLPRGGGLDENKELISDIWEKWGRHIWGKGGFGIFYLD